MKAMALAALGGMLFIATLVSSHAGDEATAGGDLSTLQDRWEYQGSGAAGEGYKEASAFLHGGRNQDEVRFNWTLNALEVKGSTFTFAGTQAGRATAKIDAARKPAAIDLLDAKRRTWCGVYELKGDTLTITLSFDSKRPATVSTDARFGEAYVTYKRAKQ